VQFVSSFFSLRTEFQWNTLFCTEYLISFFRNSTFHSFFCITIILRVTLLSTLDICIIIIFPRTNVVWSFAIFLCDTEMSIVYIIEAFSWTFLLEESTFWCTSFSHAIMFINAILIWCWSCAINSCFIIPWLPSMIFNTRWALSMI